MILAAVIIWDALRSENDDSSSDTQQSENQQTEEQSETYQMDTSLTVEDGTLSILTTSALWTALNLKGEAQTETEQIW